MELLEVLKKYFGFSEFRPHQEDVCQAAANGEDLLLVMPTGAGKSLCYQLPGLVQGGTTLVISPLIALMDDQASKLQARGLKAEALHSGRDGRPSRTVLLYSDADRERHEYFFKRDYPEIKVLNLLLSKLKNTPILPQGISGEFETALKQLKVHGGVRETLLKPRGAE